MEKLYEEMLERLKFLEAQVQTSEIQWRTRELNLAIIRVQQSLLLKIGDPLPEFLYENDGEIKIGRRGDTIVTDEWSKWKEKVGY